MSISASMNAGVLGLAANATRLSAISDNIANSGTVGYKRAEVQFASLVTTAGSRTQYNAGGVSSAVRLAITEKGALDATSVSTDIAIDGRGFLPVVNAAAPADIDTATDETVLTKAGSFRPDADGFLRNAAGYTLMGWKLNPDGTTVVANPARDGFQNLEPVNIAGMGFTGQPTTQVTFAANIPAQATSAGGDGAPITMPIEYYDALGKAERLTLELTPVVPAAGSSNQWQLRVLDSAGGGAAIGAMTIDFNATGPNAGRLSAVTPTTGAYDGATGAVTVTTAGGQAIEVNIGALNGTGGLTQFAGSFTPSAATKNGSAFASVATVEIGQDGVLSAVLTNGVRQPIFQVPVVDLVNPNGLTAIDGNAYRLSRDAGALYLWDGGTGPVGTTEGYSLERSTTDVARELTHLIETQRAYSSNAKIIQTADEMLQETTNLKR
ncbi:flagellar hook protein FlgE [Marinivivus vitaminiproducens]|uniref:flagellar hook protein FlgE n=1 Tax=Marinivivus vitaminiproducens TaxID=3035935 RepID=UPI00279B432A|nr:flagellar hook protein FlgE [Geminicoccaceae bacterium SCSIO 64248]